MTRRSPLQARGLPAGWVKRWPAGYLGPAGQVVERVDSHRWQITWPSGRVENARSLREAVTR